MQWLNSLSFSSISFQRSNDDESVSYQSEKDLYTFCDEKFECWWLCIESTDKWWASSALCQHEYRVFMRERVRMRKIDDSQIWSNATADFWHLLDITVMNVSELNKAF